jgi:hypothetical protein
MNPTDTPPVDGLIEAIQHHHWPVAVGLGITILIYIANKAGLQKRVGPEWVPRISIGLGILSAIAAQLSLGISWEEAISKGFLAGATATGLWESLLKHILPKHTDAKPAPAVVPDAAPKAKEAPKAKPAEPLKLEAPKTRKKPGPKPGSKKAKAEPETPAPTPSAEAPAVVPVAPEAAPVAPEATPEAAPAAPEPAADLKP